MEIQPIIGAKDIWFELEIYFGQLGTIISDLQDEVDHKNCQNILQKRSEIHSTSQWGHS